MESVGQIHFCFVSLYLAIELLLGQEDSIPPHFALGAVMRVGFHEPDALYPFGLGLFLFYSPFGESSFVLSFAS